MTDDVESNVSASSSVNWPEEVFCDSNILINYLNQEWEPPRGRELLDVEAILIVISEQVKDEIETLVERRRDLYTDFLKFVLEQDGEITEYSPADYLPGNDYTHLQDLQMTLAGDNRAEALTRLREFVLRYRRRADLVFDAHVYEVVSTAAPFLFELNLDDIIPNSADVGIVAGAADWTSQGGSGILVTDDAADIVDLRDDINALIEGHLGTEHTLLIWRPSDIDIENIPHGG